MPELPEVQTIVDELNAAGLLKSRITGATVFWPRTIAMPSVNSFCRRIKGNKISAIRRRGKFLVFDFVNGEYLLIHLRGSCHRFQPFYASISHPKHLMRLAPQSPMDDEGRPILAVDLRGTLPV